MFTSDNSENTNTESGKKNFIQFYDFSEKKKKRTRDYYERTSCQIFEKHLIWMIPGSISTLERIVWRTETDG